jgi:hypothetical protein
MSSEKNKLSAPMECASCGAFIPTVHDSHNGAPVVDGRVCIECNYMKVIPARLVNLGLEADRDALVAALTSERERIRQEWLLSREKKAS